MSSRSWEVTRQASTRPNGHHTLNSIIDRLHLGLDLLGKRLELVHIRLLLRPANTETLLRIRLGDLYWCQSHYFSPFMYYRMPEHAGR
jgi:hypothetical protein